MSERKEPGLSMSGLDGDEPVHRAPSPPSHRRQQSTADKGRGGGFLLTLILLILAGGVAGMAYWTLELKKTLDEQQMTLANTQQRLAEMEELLALTSDSASEAGQTLMGRLGTLEERAGEKYEHFDSEIAKLWTVSYQRNKPQLEEQKKALAAQSEQLDTLKSGLAAVEKKVDKVESSLAGLPALKKSLGGLEKTLDAQKKRIESVGSETNFALSVEKDDRIAGQQALERRIKQIEQGATGQGDIKQRIAGIEQSIQAIDGSRRQFNRSLLQLRDQISQLQRRVDGG